MKLLNFGSLNIDHVYSLPRFVAPGETIAADNYARFAGGKGLNQSLAVARAGGQVFHAGLVGNDGTFLIEILKNSGVNVDFLETIETPSGHASIQVNHSGENSIVIFGGANQKITESYIDKVLSQFKAGDAILLQNEINLLELLLQKAHQKGMKIFFNATPCAHDLKEKYSLELVSFLIVNELEASMLAGLENESHPLDLIAQLLDLFPIPEIVMTLGSKGVVYANREDYLFVPALKVKAIDTTAAGDTFIGYFIAQYLKGLNVKTCLHHAVNASAICVTRKGASDSIPYAHEVDLN